MNEQELQEVKNLKAQYEDIEVSKLEKLKKLDQKVHRPSEVFAYVFGSLFTLILGVGMCLSMKVIFTSWDFGFYAGIIIGVIGLLGIGLNPILFKKIRANSKKKHQEEILQLSNEILSSNATPETSK